MLKRFKAEVVIGQNVLARQESRYRTSGQIGKIVGYVMGIVVIDIFFLIGLPIMLDGAEPISNDSILLNGLDSRFGVDIDTFHEMSVVGSEQQPESDNKYLACHYPA